MSIHFLVIHSECYDDLNFGTTQYPIDNSSKYTFSDAHSRVWYRYQSATKRITGDQAHRSNPRSPPMNRAFVKEADGDDVAAPLYERQHSDLPNYITPEGLLLLKDRLQVLEKGIETLSKTDSL